MSLADTLNERVAGSFASLLGLKVVEATPDRVVAEVVVRPELETVPGIMHGGAIMAFADTLGAMGTALNLAPGHGTTTIESKTNFYSPGATGTTVRGECTAIHKGKKTMGWQTRVLSAEGRLIAIVTQTQMVLEPRLTPQQTMAGLFQGLDLAGQKALLAQLERGGAQVYRSMAADETDPLRKQALLDAARKEEENAETLEAQA
jgi:uncharacterized protein (TIGR00369 family)